MLYLILEFQELEDEVVVYPLCPINYGRVAVANPFLRVTEPTVAELNRTEKPHQIVQTLLQES